MNKHNLCLSPNNVTSPKQPFAIGYSVILQQSCLEILSQFSHKALLGYFSQALTVATSHSYTAMSSKKYNTLYLINVKICC